MAFQIEDIILLIGGFMAFLLSLIIAFRFSKNNLPANYFLVIFLFVLFLSFILKLTNRFETNSQLIHLAKLNYPIGLLRPSLFFLYFYYLTNPGKKFKLKHLLHFIPFLLLIIYFLPYFGLPSHEKISILTDQVKAKRWRLPSWYKYSGLLYSIIYLVLSFVQYLKFRKLGEKIFFQSYALIKSWLLLLLAGHIAFLILVSLPYYFKGVPNIDYYPFLGLSLLVIIGGSRMLSFPDLSAEEKKREKYNKLNLQQDEKVQLMKKIKDILETEKLYKQDDLRLATLAEKVQLQDHVVSYLINDMEAVSFSNFINKYRVEMAKKMLKNPKYSHFTVEAIGYEAGFFSRASFYNAFKKETGLSPVVFKKS